MKFYDTLPKNPSRKDLDRVAQLAIGRLRLEVGLDLSGERIAAIIRSLQGSGLTIRQLEDSCVALGQCESFTEKLRYGGTLTPADILAKARETGTIEAVDPTRALLDRESWARSMNKLLPEAHNV